MSRKRISEEPEENENVEPAEGEVEEQTEPTESAVSTQPAAMPSPEQIQQAILAALAQIDQNLRVLNQNVIDTAKFNKTTIEGSLKSFGDSILQAQKNAEELLKKSVPTPNAATGQQGQAYFQPNVGANGQPVAPIVNTGNPLMDILNRIVADPNVMGAIAQRYILGNNPQAQVFTMLGQRQFNDMTTENMLMRRAQWRMMQKQGWLTEEEAGAAIANQQAMMGSLIGGAVGQVGAKKNEQSQTS